MISFKDFIISFIIIFALILYLYGYEICFVMYNAEGLAGDERKVVLKNFWELRFSIYSGIIFMLFFVSKTNLSFLNKHLSSIGMNLAGISLFDKIILREFDLNEYDGMLMFTVILIEILKFKFLKNKEK